MVKKEENILGHFRGNLRQEVRAVLLGSARRSWGSAELITKLGGTGRSKWPWGPPSGPCGQALNAARFPCHTWGPGVSPAAPVSPVSPAAPVSPRLVASISVSSGPGRLAGPGPSPAQRARHLLSPTPWVLSERPPCRPAPVCPLGTPASQPACSVWDRSGMRQGTVGGHRWGWRLSRTHPSPGSALRPCTPHFLIRDSLGWLSPGRH